MTELPGQDPADDNSTGIPAWIAPGILGVLLIIAATLAGWLWWDNRAPANDSADAGFARDMTDHHAQAVEMALIVWQRSQDPEIQQIAYDIATSQQAQIGMMQGWLTEWDLSLSRDGAPMAWAAEAMKDHEMEPISQPSDMPGMLSSAQIDALRTLEPAEMDREFLRLMIEHHQGGVMMADAAVQEVDEPVLRNLATAIVNSQTAEISTMRTMLAARESA